MASTTTLTTFPLDGVDAVSWIAEPDAKVTRTSTALKHDGGVLLIDPVDAPGLDEFLETLGQVTAVTQLLDRHRRDVVHLAARHNCPIVVPSTLAGRGAALDIPGVQERAILAAPGWNESALWIPDRRLLIVAEAVGSSPYFLAHEGDQLGVHPLLRLRPPAGALGGLDPVAVAVGHGTPVTDGAAGALSLALRTARSGVPQALWRMVRLTARGSSA